MGKITGSLCAALRQAAGTRNIIRLSIDEGCRQLNKAPHYAPPGPERERSGLRNALWMNQLQVIATCDQLQIPLVEISFTPGMNMGAVTACTDYPRHYEYCKSAANAFEDDHAELLIFLRQCKYDTLVVMGYHANACVVSTVGANKFFSDEALTGKYKGALQHGFTVMTCEQILSAGDPSETTSEDTSTLWHYDRKGLEFYSTV